MIEINDLTIKFSKLDRPLVSNIRLQIKQGEKILLIGPSGSGKSVLLKTIMGLLPEKYVLEGDFHVHQQKLNYHAYRFCKIHQRIATIFQDAVNSLHPYRQIQHQFDAISPDQLESSCNSFRLQHANIASVFPRDLSGGQCQRVSMLFPYLLDSSRDILVFDEPITDIDPISRKSILQLIKDRFLSQSDKTVLYVTHQHDELKDINFHRYIIDKDQIIDKGGVDERS